MSKNCVPWMPVLQGWEWEQFWQHLELHTSAGVDLRKLPLVGLTSSASRAPTGCPCTGWASRPSD